MPNALMPGVTVADWQYNSIPASAVFNGNGHGKIPELPTCTHMTDASIV
jgi:hypothetical protein